MGFSQTLQINLWTCCNNVGRLIDFWVFYSLILLAFGVLKLICSQASVILDYTLGSWWSHNSFFCSVVVCSVFPVQLSLRLPFLLLSMDFISGLQKRIKRCKNDWTVILRQKITWREFKTKVAMPVVLMEYRREWRLCCWMSSLHYCKFCNVMR